MSLLWVMRILLWAFIVCIIVFAYIVFQPTPSASVEKIDENGVVWVQLNNISDNATIYLHYGDKVNSKAFWILK